MPDSSAVTRSAYDVIAAAFARAQALGYPELLDDMRAFAGGLPSRARVADIGCGPGRDLALLRDNGLQAVGVDLSAGMLRAGGLSGVAQADMRRLPLGTAGLDGIWCQAALLHVPHADVPLVLAEFARVLRSGGLLHLVVAEGDGERWEEGAYGTSERRWFAYHREESLSALLEAAGFTVTTAVHRSSHREWLLARATRKPI